MRAPGAPFTLTDNELMAAPAKLLTKEQRRRRRYLRAQNRKAKTQAANRERRAEGRSKVLLCQGMTGKGRPCRAYAVTGAKHCNNHLNDAERAKLGVKHPAEVRKERLQATVINGQTMTGPQMMRALVETTLDKLMYRYFLGLGMKFVGFDDEGNPVVEDEGVEKGIMLHGESKDGYIHVSKFPDLQAQIAIAEKLMDRVYGKPRQTTVLEGGVKPISIRPVRSADRSKQMSDILRRTGAFGAPHDGRRRSDASEVADDPGASGQGGPSSVVPLRPEDES